MRYVNYMDYMGMREFPVEFKAFDIHTSSSQLPTFNMWDVSNAFFLKNRVWKRSPEPTEREKRDKHPLSVQVQYLH